MLKSIGLVSVPRSYTVTQYCPGSTAAEICGVEPGAVWIAVLNAHLAMPVVGTPMPRPTTVEGPAAFVSITVTVPVVVAPNERDTAPPGVSRLAKIDVVGPVGVVGVVVVVVLLLPHAAVKTPRLRATATAPRRMTEAEASVRPKPKAQSLKPNA